MIGLKHVCVPWWMWSPQKRWCPPLTWAEVTSLTLRFTANFCFHSESSDVFPWEPEIWCLCWSSLIKAHTPQFPPWCPYRAVARTITMTTGRGGLFSHVVATQIPPTVKRLPSHPSLAASPWKQQTVRGLSPWKPLTVVTAVLAVSRPLQSAVVIDDWWPLHAHVIRTTCSELHATVSAQ